MDGRARNRFITFATRSLLAILTACSLPAVSATAGTITAASCSAQDVQAAVNAAADGAVVSVPAGQCTWTVSVSLIAGRNIAVQGAGVGATLITLDGGVTVAYLRLGTTASRVTGIEWHL